jgi:hypothetical protein
MQPGLMQQVELAAALSTFSVLTQTPIFAEK